uniref:Uncharacterized protein n=1 Tax=CrAss-like virus sp. ctYsL76 TaxID=2826826 RepID=A0A8S5QMI4_9CAUD|nr:MAG TPA: hypothetical protein [CrAss-like virus sp. ctYsL76]
MSPLLIVILIKINFLNCWKLLRASLLQHNR